MHQVCNAACVYMCVLKCACACVSVVRDCAYVSAPGRRAHASRFGSRSAASTKSFFPQAHSVSDFPRSIRIAQVHIHNINGMMRTRASGILGARLVDWSGSIRSSSNRKGGGSMKLHSNSSSSSSSNPIGPFACMRNICRPGCLLIMAGMNFPQKCFEYSLVLSPMHTSFFLARSTVENSKLHQYALGQPPNNEI